MPHHHIPPISHLPAATCSNSEHRSPLNKLPSNPTISMIKKSELFTDAKMMVLEMFELWGTAWGDKLKNNRPSMLTMETIDTWTVSLVQAQMTQAEFDIALPLSISAELEWPPGSPSDFLALARGKHTSQFPEAYTAYIQAANGTYLHPVCHATAVRVGLWNMRNEDEYVTKKLWSEIYPLVCAEYSHDSAQFNQNAIAIERKRQSDMPALAAPKIDSQSQIQAAMTAIEKIREML